MKKFHNFVINKFFKSLPVAEWNSGRAVPSGTLPDEEDITSPHIIADKADLFLAYATVPGYR